MQGGWIAPLGPEVDAFEAELADYCDRQHAVALLVRHGGPALGAAAAGAGPGDVVLTSSMTFAATANAIVYLGAPAAVRRQRPDRQHEPRPARGGLRSGVAPGTPGGRRGADLLLPRQGGRPPAYRADRLGPMASRCSRTRRSPSVRSAPAPVGVLWGGRDAVVQRQQGDDHLGWRGRC